MKAKITKASDYRDVKITEFNTLEDLLKFQEECDEELIIARPWKHKNGEKVYNVIIYDDYVEPRQELICCKDCDYYETTDTQFHHWCTYHEFAREPEDYCSDAEWRSLH